MLFCSTKGDSGNYEDDLISGLAYAVSMPFPYIEQLLQPRGVMICVANIIDCRPCISGDEKRVCAPVAFIKNNVIVPKFGFVLENVRFVKQKPVKCGRKWFSVDDPDVEYL